MKHNSLEDRVRRQIGYGLPGTISVADHTRLVDEFIQNMSAEEMLIRISDAMEDIVDDLLHEAMERVDFKLEDLK